jgi:hypothetical protein
MRGVTVYNDTAYAPKCPCFTYHPIFAERAPAQLSPRVRIQPPRRHAVWWLINMPTFQIIASLYYDTSMFHSLPTYPFICG